MIPKLPKTIHFVAILAALGGLWLVARAQDRAPSSQQAERMIEQSIARLAEWRSLKAKTRYSGHLYGHEIVGTGEYLQERFESGLKWHSSWNLQVGDKRTARLEICNGESLWIETRNDATDVELARVNLRKLRAAEATQDDSRSLHPAVDPFVGGFPGVLQSLQEQTDWTKVEASELDQDQVWVVHGNISTPPSSPELPNHVRIFLARDGEFELFPFRIEWYHRSAKEIKRRLVVDYFSITTGYQADAGQFEFDPADRDYSDQTDEYLDR